MVLFRTLLILFFLNEQMVFAAEKIETLTWFDCVKETARNNPSLESAYQSLQSSEASRKASYSSFFPQLSANVDTTHTFQPRDGNSSSGVGDSTSSFSSEVGLTEYSTKYTANLQLQQLLFDGFRTKGTVDQARAQSRVALAALSQEKAVVSYELKSAFAQLLYAQELIQISQDIKKRRDVNSRLIGLRYDSGKENKGARLLSSVNLSQADFDLRQALRNNEVSQRQLSQVMGRDIFRPIKAVGYLATKSAPATPNFRNLALATPSHYQLEAQSQAAAAGITIAKSAWYPQINGVGSIDSRGDDRFPEYDGWSVGISGSLNIFDWGNTYFNVKAARADLLRSLAELRSTDNETELSLAQDYKDFVDAVERVKIDEERLEALKLRAEIAEAQYRNGLISFQDFETITNDYINLQRTALTSRRDAVIAESNWEQSQGKGALP